VDPLLLKNIAILVGLTLLMAVPWVIIGRIIGNREEQVSRLAHKPRYTDSPPPRINTKDDQSPAASSASSADDSP